MLSAEDKILVDRYIDNTLTGIPLRDFLSRMDSDHNFRVEVGFHNKLVEGIIEAEDSRLIQKMIEATGYKKRLIPLPLKLIIIFLIITLGGIVYWEYTGQNSTTKKHNYFSLDFLKKNDTKEKNDVSATTSETINSEYKPEHLQKKISEPKFAPEVDTLASPEIIVKKDQLLFTTQLKVIVIPSDSIFSTEQVELPDQEETVENAGKEYEVEYWKSPVNYKGYKLQSDKLILFGIEMPNEVQLYSLNENLWLKHDKDYYLLQSGDDFESLIESHTVPSKLK